MKCTNYCFKPLGLLFLLCLIPLWAFSQNITVKGVVKDATGESVIGASVVQKGTSNGIITDIDGNFTLNVPSNSTIVISFVGYKTQEIPVAGKTQINVTLKEDAEMLDEVVVVGYGQMKRSDLTGSVVSVNDQAIKKSVPTSIDQGLQGRAAGVQIQANTGTPGGSSAIRIRGINSLNATNQPIFVIDGVIVDSSSSDNGTSNPLSSINPSDIVSMDVLKDASATAIYGSRGANGVVIITTKKGKSGKPTISYNGSFTVGLVNNTPEMMDGYEFVKLQQEVMGAEDFKNMYLKDGNTLEDYRKFKSYDWQKEIYRTAMSHNHHVLLNGNAGDLKYSTSVSYNDQEGVIINSDLNRYQARVNLSQQFNKRLKVDANANFASTTQNGPNPSNNTSAMSTAFMYSVWAYRPVSPSGADLKDEIYDTDIDMAEDYRFNPVLSAKNEYRRNTTNTLQANLSAEYEIIKNLKFKVAAGYS